MYGDYNWDYFIHKSNLTLIKTFVVHLAIWEGGYDGGWLDMDSYMPGQAISGSCGPGARPTKHISIEFEIRWKFKTL